MSDTLVACESCGRSGLRRSGHPCPDQWIYLASTDAKDGSVYIVWACSAGCRDKLWRPGPGPVGLIEDSAASQAALYRQRQPGCRLIEVSVEDLAFLSEVTVDMTSVLADEAEPAENLERYREHRAKRERLLKILLGVVSNGAPS